MGVGDMRALWGCDGVWMCERIGCDGVWEL